MNKTFLAIEQIASPIRRHRKQRLTLIGLGLTGDLMLLDLEILIMLRPSNREAKL